MQINISGRIGHSGLEYIRHFDCLWQVRLCADEESEIPTVDSYYNGTARKGSLSGHIILIFCNLQEGVGQCCISVAAVALGFGESEKRCLEFHCRGRARSILECQRPLQVLGGENGLIHVQRMYGTCD